MLDYHLFADHEGRRVGRRSLVLVGCWRPRRQRSPSRYFRLDTRNRTRSSSGLSHSRPPGSRYNQNAVPLERSVHLTAIAVLRTGLCSRDYDHALILPGRRGVSSHSPLEARIVYFFGLDDATVSIISGTGALSRGRLIGGLWTGSDVTPTPTLCTCNNVFFNIWSACSFGSGNNTLPMFSSWLARCTTGSIDLNASAKMKDGGESMIGIDIPVWADIPVPGNTSFDLQEAVVRSVKPSTQKTWTTLQIILPIVSTLLGVVLTVIFLKVRSNRGNSPTKSRISVPALPKIPSFIHPRRRVRHLNLDQRSLSEWEIEPPVAPPPSLESAPPHISPDPSVGIPPSPPDTPHRDSTVPGHPSVYSDTSRQSTVAHHEGIPSTSDVYPFGREEQERIQRLPLNQRSTPYTGMLSLPTTTATNTGTGTTGTWTPRTWGDSIRDIRLPKFKRKPVQIVPIEPTERFRIDGSSEGSPSVRQSLASAGQRTSGTGGTEIRMSGMGRGMGMGMGSVDEIDEYHDHDHPSEGYFESIQEDEDTSLITDEERRGSENYSARTKSTHGTSINSRVRIESPTASTVSPHSTMQSGIWPLTNSFVKPKQAPPPLPPVPKLPAPVPPPVTPRTLREPAAPLESGFGLRGNPASPNNNRIMSPIPEDQNSIRSGHSRELVINLNNLSLSSSSQSRPTPTRSLSDGSETSVQSNSRRPLPSPAHSSSSSSHHRSASAASRGPLPDTPPLYFNNLNNAHRRSGSNNSLSSIQRTLSPPPRLDMLDDPLFMPDRRGLSADDTASFYLTADPPGHGQSQSQSSSSGSGSRTDPGAFYPGAVRGAGYG
ncbi:hypothetical protein CVT25_001754 [Psilocybe cyanescens]|uniref:Uncharacterized protein n=1 Tax=Psilocybe cyanescens TaxID=93625 RepID=A0A409WPQ1_PSICY|nr:hypothetical protein CVT25_001754 [Psilocybe cyanescens]